MVANFAGFAIRVLLPVLIVTGPDQLPRRPTGPSPGLNPAGEFQVVSADSGTVGGTVLDPGGAGVGGVEVVVPAAELSATTDSAGRFKLRVPVGQQVFVFRKIGYRPQALSVEVAQSPKDLGTVTLVPGAFELPEIRVSAKYAKPERYAYTTKYDDFYRRRRLGAGKYLDRETLDKKVALATHEYLRGLAGVRVDARPAGTGSRVFFLRCNESPPAIGVWVDGRRLMPPWGTQKQSGLQLDQRIPIPGGEIRRRQPLMSRLQLRTTRGRSLSPTCSRASTQQRLKRWRCTPDLGRSPASSTPATSAASSRSGRETAVLVLHLSDGSRQNGVLARSGRIVVGHPVHPVSSCPAGPFVWTGHTETTG